MIPGNTSAYPEILHKLLKSNKTAVFTTSDNNIHMAGASCATVIAIRELFAKPVAAMVLPKKSNLTETFRKM